MLAAASGACHIQDWGGWGRTSNLPVNSRALCRLSYTPKTKYTADRHFTFTRRARSRPGILMKSDGKIGAVVLAAGRSRRFGGAKLRAGLAGRAIVAHVLEVVTAARQRRLLDEAIVVAAENDREIQELARRSQTTPAINPDPARGLSHSVVLGLSALPADVDAALVLLGDQPLVRVEVIEALIHAWRNGTALAVRPRYSASPETPGHPVLLSRSVWPLAERLEGDAGFGHRFAPGSPEVTVVDVPGDNPDIDTPADLLTLENRAR
jgi:molybdenum cofactor cytidylyltransferase